MLRSCSNAAGGGICNAAASLQGAAVSNAGTGLWATDGSVGWREVAPPSSSSSGVRPLCWAAAKHRSLSGSPGSGSSVGLLYQVARKPAAAGSQDLPNLRE